MKDFGEWFNGGAVAPREVKSTPPTEKDTDGLDYIEFSNGVWWNSDGYQGKCHYCEKDMTLDWIDTIDEAKEIDPSTLYCGSSPRCCP